jgi:flagellar hook-basal body complex protein FliE
MSVLPIDPAAFGAATEWQVPGLDGTPGAVPGTAAAGAPGTSRVSGVAGVDVPGVTGPDAAGSTPSGESFGDLLAQQITNLSDLQESAASASQALANGTATDASSVVIAVEKAQLAMQLAGQIRTRAAEAVNDIFHTQI